jgi:general secretion pathway protein A
LQTSPYTRFFSFFGLRENPFAVSPDPRYLFMTPRIQEAWGAIEYGIRSREGIILLTGEAGTGKTSLIRRLLEWLHEQRMPTAFIFNSHLESKHLYDFMLADFGVRPDPRWQGNALMCLSQWLTERCREGQIPVLIVDEAQGLPVHVLEEIRLLLNLETPQEKLLQIVLAGQPELEGKLNRPEMRQLKQRITLRCKTAPLTPKEARHYIQARLDVAGAAGRPIFSPDAVAAAHGYSRGIPRVMNLLCEHALINAYAGNMSVVPARVLDEVAREFHFDRDSYVPAIYSGISDALALPGEGRVPLVRAETSTPAIQAMPSTASASTEPSNALPLPEGVAPLPEIQTTPSAASALAGPLKTFPLYEAVAPPQAIPVTNQAAVNQPQLNEHVVHAADDSTATIFPPAARQAVKKVATGPRRRKPPLSSRLLATFSDNWPKTLLSPSLKSKLRKQSHDFRRALRHIWSDVSDERRLRRIKATVESQSERGLRRLSATFSKAQLSLEHQWKNAAPIWQRTKASLLHWLEQPQRLRRSLADSRTQRPSSVAPLTPLKVAAWPRVNRAQKRLRKPLPQSVGLPSTESGVNVNVIVMRWLRQPFRASTSTASPRTATSRNR